MPKQIPLIRPNPLTGGWALITKYRVRGGVIEAREKFDVTSQIEEIVALHLAAKPRRRKTRSRKVKSSSDRA